MVNPAYSLDLRASIHLAFTVARAVAGARSGLLFVGIDKFGLVLGPFMLGLAMRAEYPAEKQRQTPERGFIDLNAGVDRLTGYETVGENLRQDRVPPMSGRP